MDDDRRDLINHLFALTTGLLEDAAEEAIEGQAADGQSPNLQTEDFAARAEALHRSVQKLTILADSIRVIVDLKD